MESGTPRAKVAAAAARVHWFYRNGYNSTGGAVTCTKAQIRQEFHNDEKAFNYAIGRFTAKKTPHPELEGAFLVAASVILGKVNQHAADMFFDRLLAGDGASTDAVFVLRESLISNGRSVSPYGRLEMVLRHWNHWRQNKKLSNGRRLPVRGKYPEKLEF